MFHKYKMNWLLCALLIISMILFTACGNTADTKKTETIAASESETQSSETKSIALEDGVLDIATNAAFPPYEYYEGDKIVGIDADIAAAIAEQLGYQVKFHDMEFGNIIASIESGKADIGIAGITVTDERLESVNFSDSYATGIQAIIVTKNSDIKVMDDLAGKKIGTQFGTTGEIYAQDDFGVENVQSFDKGADAVVALLAGNIDCVIIDKEPARSFIKTDDSLTLLDTDYAVEDYAIAVAKGETALLDELNQAIAVLKADGTLQKIIDHYINAD